MRNFAFSRKLRRVLNRVVGYLSPSMQIKILLKSMHYRILEPDQKQILDDYMDKVELATEELKKFSQELREYIDMIASYHELD